MNLCDSATDATFHNTQFEDFDIIMSYDDCSIRVFQCCSEYFTDYTLRASKYCVTIYSKKRLCAPTDLPL